MKRIFIYLLIISILFSNCGKYIADFKTILCTSNEQLNLNYSKAAQLENLLEQLTKQGIPGVVMVVQSQEGLWGSAKGYAKIEDKMLMQLCHLQYLQSISKTYMAVAILKLYEERKINLDESIAKYLPLQYHHYITDIKKISVRMLLNHTSGIPEYNSAPAYISYLLQHPDHYFTPNDYLKYIDGKKLLCTPGTKYIYTNTNYLILALIADATSGNHAKLITETIFKPLRLESTYYRNEPGYLKYSQLVNSYWDRYSNGIIENVSQLQRMNVSTLIGDDGIVSTAIDALKFLKGLFEEKILSRSTIQQMQTWVNNRNGKPVYGLGLSYKNINGIVGFGHSGGGIGAGCELYYFPSKKLYYFIAINLGTVTESPLHIEAQKTLEKIHELLMI